MGPKTLHFQTKQNVFMLLVRGHTDLGGEGVCVGALLEKWSGKELNFEFKFHLNGEKQPVPGGMASLKTLTQQ